MALELCVKLNDLKRKGIIIDENYDIKTPIWKLQFLYELGNKRLQDLKDKKEKDKREILFELIEEKLLEHIKPAT